MAFSENLIKYRKMKAYTQDEVAEMMGVSRQSVSKWENGESMPDITKIVKLAEYLNVSIDELFDREQEIKTNQNITATQEIKLGLKTNFFHLICICLIILILGIVIGFILNKEIIGNEKNKEVSINEIEISGFEFETSNPDGVRIQFIPSIYNENVSFIVYANGEDSYYDTKSQVSYNKGVCQCTLNTKSSMLYNIVLEIKYAGETRYITLAEKVWGDGSGQNIQNNEGN